MKFLILLAVAIVACAASEVNENVYKEWKAHVAKFNRKHATPGQAREAFENFAKEHARVQEHNARFRAGEEAFELGINQFADMTADEKSKHTGLTHQEVAPAKHARYLDAINYVSPKGVYFKQVDADANIPASRTWSAYIGTVRNQGNAGTCYAHAAAKAEEINIRAKFGKSYNLSPQFIVDCSVAYGNAGVNGGTPMNSYDALIKQGGTCFVEEAQDPYKAAVTTASTCSTLCAAQKTTCKLNAYVMSKQNDFNALKTVLNQGPAFVSLFVNEVTGTFFSYKSGVYTDTTTGTNNHAVTGIGYGTLNGINYVEILNSWGTSWGMNGTAYINAASIGITNAAWYPNVTCT